MINAPRYRSSRTRRRRARSRNASSPPSRISHTALRIRPLQVPPATYVIGGSPPVGCEPALGDDDLICVRVDHQIGVVSDDDYLALGFGRDEQRNEFIKNRLRIQVFFGWSMINGRSSASSSARYSSNNTIPRVPGDRFRMSTPS